MIELTDDSLKQFVQEGDCVLFYYTDGCPMCPTVRKILAALGDIRSAQLCYEQCPESVRLCRVPGVPTVLTLRDGAVRESLPGFRPKEQYAKLMEGLANG